MKSNFKDRWQAIIDRSSQADGKFVYAVITTGIYCRPVCASRKPKRENVQFYDNWQQAESAGFRPCASCKPRLATLPDPKIEWITNACRMIETTATEPTLEDLAQAAGKSPYHFHRLFVKALGITPKQYAQQNRQKRVRENLLKYNVTHAVYESGYESGSRFYETAAAELGMTPGEYKKGAAGITIRYTITESSLGQALVAVTDKGICCIDLDDSPQVLLDRLRQQYPQAEIAAVDPDSHYLIAQAIAFLHAPEEGHQLPLDIQGTAFQRQVWIAMQDILPGNTASYADIAAKIGKPKAVRAVARACAANKLAVAVPCHRVIRKNGQPGGYRWGSERKAKLLELEKMKQ